MTQSELKKKWRPVFIVLVGMVLTHLFFTLFVYRSNLNLYQNSLSIMEAGYLPVPNANILPSLQKLDTALKGALFYTLTVGIVLPFLVYLAAYAWDRGYRRSRIFLIILSGFVIFCMMMLNRHGINPIVTIWFLTVYISVFKLTLRGLDGTETRLSVRRLITHLVLLSVLGAAWTTVPRDINFFLSVRDHLLLSNSFGEHITDFYYRYSPYPTHSYKTLLRKQLKTYRIEGDMADIFRIRMKSRLLQYDYLPVDTDRNVDVVIRISDNHLSFSVNDRTVLKTEIDEFLQSPSTTLSRVSSRGDRNDFTRRLLAFSLFYGLPVFLYTCLFAFFQQVFDTLPGRVPGFRLSAAGCLAVGIAALALFRVTAPATVPIGQLKTTLESGNPGSRVTALRTISEQGLDPTDYMENTFTDNGSSIPERIWWAISLGNTTGKKATGVLLKLLDDPNPLVACKAYSSLAKKNYRPAIPNIIEKLGTSRHWYVQGYAYDALRSLGWKQKTSS